MKIDENCTSTNCCESESRSVALDHIKNFKSAILINEPKRVTPFYNLNDFIKNTLPKRFNIIRDNSV